MTQKALIFWCFFGLFFIHGYASNVSIDLSKDYAIAYFWIDDLAVNDTLTICGVAKDLKMFLPYYTGAHGFSEFYLYDGNNNQNGT